MRPGQTHPINSCCVHPVPFPQTLVPLLPLDDTPYHHTQMDDEATLTLAGKSYGMIFSSWRKFYDVLDIGCRAAVAANPRFLSEL